MVQVQSLGRELPCAGGTAKGKKKKKDGRIVVTRGGGESEWGFLFNGYRVSVWDDEEVLKMDSGNGCTAM